MSKRITDSQMLGELGETAVQKLVLEMHFIHDHRGRLEAGTDGIIELREPRTGAPFGKLLGEQVKSTEGGKSDDMSCMHACMQMVMQTKSKGRVFWARGSKNILSPQDASGTLP